MNLSEKMKTRAQLVHEVSAWKSQKMRIGFTSGAFDILHAGHVDYLEKARELCDVLIVGVNSDASVKRYKGEGRPIISEAHRLKVLAALESVSVVFLFDERRNQRNIELLKPDFYIKAGDYNQTTLTSSAAVESYGGSVKLIPLIESISSSDIIQKVAVLSGQTEEWIAVQNTEHLNKRPHKSAPAIFLDRDGTINRDIHYLHEPERFELLPGVIEGLQQFQAMGYRLVIITNQPGIGMGYFTKEAFYQVNLEMLKQLSAHGILIDRIYFCPHSKAEQCDCRKPGTALVDRAVTSLNLDLKHSYFIGDKATDVATGVNAGIQSIQIVETDKQSQVNTVTARTLAEAARWVLRQERSR